ncbi:JmjC domain-containing protein [Agromyces bauzanensis]
MFTTETTKQLVSNVNFGTASIMRGCFLPVADVLSLVPPEAPSSLNYPDGSVEDLSPSAMTEMVERFRRGEDLEGTIKVQLGTGSVFGADAWASVIQGVEIRANLFISTTSRSGIKPHFDDHHVFAVQLEGQKDWQLGGVVATASPERVSRYPEHEPVMKEALTTKPGDVLYMPPGEWHGTSTPKRSVHITVGVYPPTYAEILRQATHERAQTDPLVRRQLPLAATPDGFIAPVAPSSDQLTLLATRIARLPLATRDAIEHRLSLTRRDAPSHHEARLSEVVAQLDTSVVSSIYARGSGARGAQDPWDIDFLVVTRDDQSANALALAIRPRPSDSVPLDIKVVSTAHLVTTPDGKAKRIQLASEARLLWGEDVLSMMAAATIDEGVLLDIRDRCARVAEANIEALRRGDNLDPRRVAKSLLRLGSVFATRATQTVMREPATCAAFLVLEFPELAPPVRLLMAALSGDVENSEIIVAGDEVVTTVAHDLVR